MMRQSVSDMRESQQRRESGIEALTARMSASLGVIDSRTRALEDYRNRQVGAMALIGGVCGLVGALLVKLAFWGLTQAGEQG